MSISELKAQINNLKMRISQLDQFGYEEESTVMTKDLRGLEFDLSQLELEEILKEKEKAKKPRRRRVKKVVEEDTPE